MRPLRLLVLRRLIAACLTVCLGFFSAESLTAEVHDGDATHAELVQADGAREHGAAHQAALVTVDLDHHASAGTASVPGHPHESPAHGDGGPGHAGHACHCGHAHVAPLPLAAAAPRPLVGVQTPGSTDEPAVLRSRANEPALRPPIG